MKHLLAFLVLFPLLAGAATITATWTNPTQNTDGSALTPVEITQTRIEYGSCNGTAFGTKAGDAKLAGNGTTRAMEFGPGTYCFRAYTTANGEESAASGVAQATVPFPKPQAPSLSVSLTVSGPTAYSVIKSTEQLVLLPVGTVPLGTACDPEQGVVRNGIVFNVVPTGAVTFSGSARPVVVLASCG